jgi:hypothetical protein
LQTGTYLGPLLRVVGLMVSQIVKFGVVVVMLFIGYVFGLMYISSGDTSGNHPFSDMSDTVIYLFELTVGANDFSPTDEMNSNSMITQIYLAMFVILVSILLLNLLIALMTTEFESVRDLAKSERAYLKARAAYEFSHRTAFIPPPLNIITFVITTIIHWINFPFAMIWPSKLNMNIYNHLHV